MKQTRLKHTDFTLSDNFGIMSPQKCHHLHRNPVQLWLGGVSANANALRETCGDPDSWWRIVGKDTWCGPTAQRGVEMPIRAIHVVYAQFTRGQASEGAAHLKIRLRLDTGGSPDMVTSKSSGTETQLLHFSRVRRVTQREISWWWMKLKCWITALIKGA